MIGLFRFFLGVSEYSCDPSETPALTDALMRRGIYFFLLRNRGEKTLFRTFFARKRAVLALKNEIPSLRSEKDSGLPPTLFRYRRRPGILLGALLCVWMLLLSEKFIWTVDVSGNEKMSDAEVIGIMESLGVGVGSYIPSLDLWEKCNEALRTGGKFAFLSVNLEGTTAHIVVKEREEKTPSEWQARDDSSPSNLVADRPGKITGYEISSGQLVKTIGATVGEGEILVSGIVNTKRFPDDTFRLERSVGRVWAETVRLIEVRVPLTVKKTRETERIPIEKSVVFFGKEIKFFKKSGNPDGRYDIIEKKKRWTLFAAPGLLPAAPLPVFSVGRYAVGNEEYEVRLTEEAAKRQAWEDFRARYGEEMKGKELLSLRTEEGMSEDGEEYLLRAVFGCLENIAREIPIGFDELEH